MKRMAFEDWPRCGIFRFFGSLADPFYMVSFNIDVAPLCRAVKAKGLSFYHSMVWVVTNAVNGIEAFRCTADREGVSVIDRRIPSFTHLDKGSELFKIITLPCEGGMEDFCRAAAEKISVQTEFIDQGSEGGDLIYISCLPWLDMTALTNEHDVGTEETKLDSVPRIAWGKYIPEGDRMRLNISVEVNHRFIDGVHIGMLAQSMEELINSSEN